MDGSQRSRTIRRSQRKFRDSCQFADSVVDGRADSVRGEPVDAQFDLYVSAESRSIGLKPPMVHSVLNSNRRVEPSRLEFETHTRPSALRSSGIGVRLQARAIVRTRKTNPAARSAKPKPVEITAAGSGTGARIVPPDATMEPSLVRVSCPEKSLMLPGIP